jgi:hypothetical protein
VVLDLALHWAACHVSTCRFLPQAAGRSVIGLAHRPPRRDYDTARIHSRNSRTSVLWSVWPRLARNRFNSSEGAVQGSP